MCKLRELVLEGWLMTSAPSAACQLPSAAGDTVLAAGTTQIDINSGVQCASWALALRCVWSLTGRNMIRH